MIGSGHKTDKVFAHYANHIKKESALETIAKISLGQNWHVSARKKIIDVLKNKVIGTFFDTVGVVEWVMENLGNLW